MYDLVVIGGGSGGLRAAAAAAQVGARVALIEKQRPGVEGWSEASVPSKGLVQAARVLRQVRQAGEFGVKVEPPRVDFPAVLQRLRTIGEAAAAATSEEALRARGIEVYHGAAAFQAYDTVLVDGQQRVEGQRFIIATGSRPARPSVPGLAETGSLDNTTVWSLQSLPESLIVIGGGAVALEFAQVFARFGSRVTVLTDQDRILPREDPELSGAVACMLAGEGVTIQRRAEIEKVEPRAGGKACVYRDGQTGQRAEAVAAEILCAGGRLANVEDLNLEAVGLHVDPARGVEVDDHLQTHSVRIFAIGDVLLRNPSSQAAEREAEVAFHNAVLRRRKKMDYGTLPRATFLDPELATVGLSEADAKAEALEHRVFRASYADLDRARIDGRTTGFAKLVASPAGKILGATVLGEEAVLVLQQLVVAMESGAGLDSLAAASQVYPSYGRLIRDLAERYRATRLDRGIRAAALRLFFGFQPRTGGTAEDGAPNGAEAQADADAHAQASGAGAGHGH